MKYEKQSHLTLVVDGRKIGVALCSLAESETKHRNSLLETIYRVSHGEFYILPPYIESIIGNTKRTLRCANTIFKRFVQNLKFSEYPGPDLNKLIKKSY